ncbi:MAG: hypothetical protein ACI8TP_002703 [Acidimicrobiales bacterium]|jgi:hypothetical protein
MFDTGGMALADLADLIERVQPLTLSQEQLLAVPEALASLFPWGGIQRGWSVGVAGDGAWSIATALWAEALGAEGWVALVGAPDVGLAAASQAGVRLDRVIVVETPPASQWATVVATLIEAFDIVAIDPVGRVGQREARRLTARAREQGTVLFHLDGGQSWPTAIDLTLTGSTSQWEGIGRGHGYLRSRQLLVDAVGRRTGHPRSTTLSLPLGLLPSDLGPSDLAVSDLAVGKGALRNGA